MPRGREDLANQERVSCGVRALLQDDSETATIKIEGNFAQAHPLCLHLLLLCLPPYITLDAIVHHIPLSSLHSKGPFCFYPEWSVFRSARFRSQYNKMRHKAQMMAAT